MSDNNIMSIQGQLVGMPLAGPESFSQQQLDYLKRALGVDETLLFSTGTPPSTGDINLSESMFNFERIGISFQNDDNDVSYQEFPCVSGKDIVLFCAEYHLENGNVCLYLKWGSFGTNADGTALVAQRGGYNNIYTTNKGSNATYAWTKPFKIVGIHRIAGGNT